MEASKLNQNKWGVCGFVAAIQAASDTGVVNLLKDTDYNTLFPVIDKFCGSNADIEEELLDFSAVFGVQYAYKNLAEVVGKMKTDTTLLGDNMGIAMTANGVSRLCKSLGLKNSDFHGTTATTNSLASNLKSKKTIYGLGRATGKPGGYRNGLLHWVYIDSNGNLLTWGQSVSPDKTVDFLTSNGYDKVTHYIPLN
jgi:hypothetical protein